MEVIEFGGRGKYTIGHIQLWLKVGPIVYLADFHLVKTEVSYHVLRGRPWLHKHRLVPSTYHQCVKGRLNDRMIRIAANPSPVEQAEAHLAKSMFYDQWAPSGESSVLRAQSTFMPSGRISKMTQNPIWGSCYHRKRKGKKRPLQDQKTHHNVSGFGVLMAGLYTNYEGARGPHVIYKRALGQSGNKKFGVLCSLRKLGGRK